MKRLRLRMARHSALLVGLRRLFGARRRVAPVPPPADEPAPLPVEPAPLPVEPAPWPVVGPAPTPIVPAPGPAAGAPAQSYTGRVLLGLILGLLVARACGVGSIGGVQAVNIPNIPYFLAAIAAVAAVSLHIYSFRAWIWPRLQDEGFPTTRFGGPDVTRGFYRTVWSFFTVAWLGTIILMFFFAFGDIIPYVVNIVYIVIAYWIGILVVIFVVTALSLGPGESYVKTLLKSFQWVIVLLMVVLMYWGTKI